MINLFAKLIGLGGLAKRVMKIFKKIRKRIDKAVNKILAKAKKAGRKLMAKLGIGKKKKKGEEIKDDKRTDKQKKDDLQKGVKAGTAFVKSGKKDKKTIDKKLEQYENQYQLKELKLIVDNRDEKGMDKVHIHGKVNPVLDGEIISADIDVNSLEKTVAHHPGGYVSYADPLTANRKKGSKPGKIEGWKHAQLLNKEHNEWRRGHMVSQAFGGKGSSANMSIITQTINSKMETGPERYAKKETAKGETLIYKTTWQNHPDKGNIKNFGKSIMVEVSDKNGVLPTKRFPFNDLHEPAESTENVVLHLNSLGEGMIKDHFGVDLLFAREMIIAKGSGRYDSIIGISTKMTSYYKTKGYIAGSDKFIKLKTQLILLASSMRKSNDKLKF